MKKYWGLLPLVAWIACSALRRLAPYLRDRLDVNASLPLVSLQAARTDITSNVHAFVLVATWALLACLIVEPAKAIASERFGRQGLLAYAVLVLYQCALLADTLHAYVNDWWVWLLATFRLGRRLSIVNADGQGLHFPGISLAAAIIIGAAWFWTAVGDEHGSQFGNSDA